MRDTLYKNWKINLVHIESVKKSKILEGIIMKKKNLATAMAAAMTLGAVAPVVANAAAVVVPAVNLDARLASGYTSPTVRSRVDIYNTNGTQIRTDDTLKTAFKDAKIIAEKQDKENSYADKFVVATKAQLADINIAKANIETARTEIEAARTAGATVTKKETLATFDGAAFVESKEEVTVTVKGAEPKLYVFNGVDGKVEIPEVAIDLEAIFTGLNAKLATDVIASSTTAEGVTTPAKWEIDEEVKKDVDGKITDATKSNYADINRIKYTIEKNIAKFDVQKDETGTNNENLKVTLLKKGTNKVAVELTFKNFAKEDKNLVMNIPANTDFTGHWAEAEITEAMLQGLVDATGTYRPNNNVTRAEFAKIACTVFNIPVVEGQEEPFSDVKSADWFHKYVAALYNTKVDGQSVVQGSGDELFNPNTEITREESAVIIAKLVSGTAKDTKVQVGLDANKKPIMVDVDVLTAFKDDKEIATWADQAVDYLNTKEYVAGKVIAQGSEGKFMPKSKISRAETLVMMNRAEQAKKAMN
jgi:hypothetical protein